MVRVYLQANKTVCGNKNMRLVNKTLLPRRLSGKVLWIGCLLVLGVCSAAIYKTWQSNLDQLNYLTVRQAQSHAQGGSLLKEFDQDIHFNLLLQSFLYLLLMIGLFTCFLFLGLYQVINRRLHFLSQHFRNAADRGCRALFEPLQAEGNDELAVLASSFNHLVEKLRPTYESLEQAVHEQTLSLDKIRQEHRKEAAKLETAQQELELAQCVLDHAGEALYLLDPDGRFLDVNETACRGLGYTREELRSLTVFDIDPNFSPEIWPDHWETSKQKKTMRIESEHRHKDGDTFPVEISINYFECGGKEYNCAFVRDLSEQKQEERERLIESQTIQEQQQALVHLSTQPAMVQGDIQAMARQITDAAARLLGVQRASVWWLQEDDAFLRCVDLFDARSREHTSDFILKTEEYPNYFTALKSGRVINAADAWRDPRTREFLDTYLQPNGILSMLDGTIRFSGNVVGVLCCESVETKRYWTEPEIRFVGELADQLSLALLNRSYRHSEKQARQEAQSAVSASQAKSSFLASMSHEIRTPMNAILGFVDLLLQEKMTDEQLNYVQVVHRSAENLLSLLNDILDFSRIEAGKMKIEVSECSLPNLLEDLDSMMRPLAKQKGLTFEILQCRELPEQIRTDPVRLRQCLLNLTNNAIKYTETGHVYVNISRLEKDNASFVQFAVEDTGVGIPPDQQEAIFDAYAQAETTMSHPCSGTGLGLAITRNLARLLDCQLTVSSTPGTGSVFTLTLPLKTKTEDDGTLYNKYENHCQVQQAPPAAANCRLSGNVLVVEDNPSNQILISMMLRKMGLDPAMANDGVEGVEKAQQGSYDIILMDMQMPRMNGYAATQQLRSVGYTVPIIAVTANAMKGDEEKCLQAGCSGYLSKPVDRKKLQKLLQQYLKTDDPATQPSASASEPSCPSQTF